MGFDPPVPRTQPSHLSHMLPLQATELSVTLTQTCICSEEWVFCSRPQWCGTTTTQLCELPTKHSSVSYPQNTALSVTHETQLCQLPTTNNTALSVTHKTQLFQLPTKQHGSVSYPQNTALWVTHKTTRLCQLPTKQHGYPQNCLVEHEQGQQYSHRWEPLVPGPGRTAALQWWSYASTQCLHLLGKTHIITKHQHKVYICQKTTTQKHIITKHQHNVYICQRKHTLSSNINTVSTSVQKKKKKIYHQASTQCLHLLKKCLYFLSCKICHKIHYL